jgi:hypothetical protein
MACFQDDDANRDLRLRRSRSVVIARRLNSASAVAKVPGRQ